MQSPPLGPENPGLHVQFVMETLPGREKEFSGQGSHDAVKLDIVKHAPLDVLAVFLTAGAFGWDCCLGADVADNFGGVRLVQVIPQPRGDSDCAKVLPWIAIQPVVGFSSGPGREPERRAVSPGELSFNSTVVTPQPNHRVLMPRALTRDAIQVAKHSALLGCGVNGGKVSSPSDAVALCQRLQNVLCIVESEAFARIQDVAPEVLRNCGRHRRQRGKMPFCGPESPILTGLAPYAGIPGIARVPACNAEL
eukprot:425723-Rhodomonas_salina.3